METIKLDNGIDLILIPRDTMRSAAGLFCIKTGSAHETTQEAGISHFIEHAVFRKTSNRSMQDIKKPIEEVGGTLNAYTGKNLTVFYSKVPDTQINEAMDILSDITYNAVLDNADLDKEREIINEEISMYEDDPGDIVYENLFQNVFDNQFGKPIIGYRETVNKFNQNDLTAYYNKFFTPSNTVVSIAGKFDRKEIINKLNKIPSKTNINNSLKSPMIKTENVFVEKTKKELSQHYIINGFEAPSRASREYYATLILNTLLGSGMSSVLFTKIREEESLVYEVGSEYNCYLDSSLFVIFAATSAEKVSKYNTHLESILSNFNMLEDFESWFNYGKKRLIGKITLDIENNLSMALNMLDIHLYYGKLLSIDEIINEIEKVTINDVKEVAKKIFNSYKYTSILKPE